MPAQSISSEERLRYQEGHYTDHVTAFCQRLARVGLDRVLIVLLDIGKNVHWTTAWTTSSREPDRRRWWNHGSVLNVLFYLLPIAHQTHAGSYTFR